MRTMPCNFPETKQRAFSLVELMVTMSIMSLVVALALPNIITLNIRAARAEMQTNSRALFTAAHAHHAENGIYPSAVFGVMIEESPVLDDGIKIMNHCNEPNDGIGFKFSNCENLRYYYQLASGLCSDGGAVTMERRSTCFTISAMSSHTSQSWVGGIDTNHVGSKPPTRFCKKPDAYSLYFHDHIYMYENAVVEFPLGSSVSDALKNCFAN